MPSIFECPHCASRETQQISGFHSNTLNAKITIYQCQECLNLFDVSYYLPEIGNDNERQASVTVYTYDRSRHLVPINFSQVDRSRFRLSNLGFETLTNFDVFTTSADNSVSHLLGLLFGLLQIIFGIWLLSLAFDF